MEGKFSAETYIHSVHRFLLGSSKYSRLFYVDLLVGIQFRSRSVIRIIREVSKFLSGFNVCWSGSLSTVIVNGCPTHSGRIFFTLTHRGRITLCSIISLILWRLCYISATKLICNYFFDNLFRIIKFPLSWESWNVKIAYISV